ncbi:MULTISPECIES: DUF4199 domain-containing protein [unclassified Leeuwenhoekiella]|uniref:DUF4199 domain-containing protein n=1 Tax=unclassified Leeuwenhoekiella TaxID=2615029 RepID=UPI000C4FF19E|nr:MULTISPECIES: DUF4199 domain-containing protein [unclassified Leeuwenhoekiella]MAW97133.1 DUF4199 domain-containing protein [Leeuwenhoekiella sp.]MBA82649.1 DUF4199 domain-containing protein [Leeuwenhoekiella sp.]|tara:strand:+ start:27195 stop:27671 length:477 start_codon:yes stop_codon:yes gene_type:complete
MISFRLEFKWAVIYTLFLFIWMIFEVWMGWHDKHIARHHIYTLFFYIPAALIYYLALTDKRNNFYGGIMTYKQGFVAGLIITLFIALLAAPAQYIISTYITPDYFENVKAYAVEKEKTTIEEAEEFFNLKSYMIQSVVAAIISGLLFTTLLGLFVKRK